MGITLGRTGINSLTTSGTPSYTGSVMGQSWRSQKPVSVTAVYRSSVNDPAMVTYAYDDRYQFESNKFGAPNFGSNSFTETLNVFNLLFVNWYDYDLIDHD
jgi:hypothetical protein